MNGNKKRRPLSLATLALSRPGITREGHPVLGLAISTHAPEHPYASGLAFHNKYISIRRHANHTGHLKVRGKQPYLKERRSLRLLERKEEPAALRLPDGE